MRPARHLVGPHPRVAAIGGVGQGIEHRVRDLLGALDGEDTTEREIAGDADPVVTLLVDLTSTIGRAISKSSARPCRW